MKNLKKLIVVMSSIAIMLASLSLNTGKALAAPEIIATAQGTVSKGTTSELLCMYNTSEGLYKIKIDATTDVSDCKILSVGKAVRVELTMGNDGYLHAASIKGAGQSNLVTVDNENRTTVSGTVLENSTETLMYLSTNQGEMQIKLDSTTDVSGCRIVVSGMKVNVVVARGNDAYMHAISISDYAAATDYSAYTVNSGTATAAVTSPTVTASAPEEVIEGTTAVSGTPTDSSSYSTLYLNTDSGVMQIAIDDSTDTSSGFVFTSANKLTAYVYRGSDAVMHAKKISGKKSEKVETSNTLTTFTGTVSSSSTEDTLIVLTSGGTMKFKIDSDTVLKGGKGVLKGKAITISANTGNDNFWHAVSLTVR